MNQPDLIPDESATRTRLKFRWVWVFDLLLILVLAAGGYLRFVGVNWDADQHLHPDERFLTMVEDGIKPVQNLAQYFDTAVSTLNPNNNPSFGFFVYGTLPIFIVRYVSEWLGQADYNHFNLVGRQLSALADLLTVLLVYLIAARLYHRRMALLAAAFSALAVLPIQLSHFFTVDTFTNFFGFIAVYFAVRIMTAGLKPGPARLDEPVSGLAPAPLPAVDLLKNGAIKWLIELAPYLAFGTALGMAAASKINAVVLAGLLPIALGVRYYRLPQEERRRRIWLNIRNLLIAAVVSFIIFRIFQPYAFSGPGLFGLKPNPKWIANMTELANQSGGDVDFPPALQWARRPIWFSWLNLTEWGLGWPLGLLAWAGFLWMGWRIFKQKEWQTHLLLWAWTAGYFAWQSLSFTASMRYQMLIYPTLEIMAAWTVFELWKLGPWAVKIKKLANPGLWKIASVVVGVGVLAATGVWAYAFSTIYTRPMTRVASSRWIYQAIPGPFNLKINTSSGIYSQPLPNQAGASISLQSPFEQAFIAQEEGFLTQIELQHVLLKGGIHTDQTITAEIFQGNEPLNPIAYGSLSNSFQPGGDERGQAHKILLADQTPLHAGGTYRLKISIIAGSGPVQIMGPSLLSLLTQDGVIKQSLPEPVLTIQKDQLFTSTFAAFKSGVLKDIFIPKVVDQMALAGKKTLRIAISSEASSDPSQAGSGQIANAFPLTPDGNGLGYTITLEKPFTLVENRLYRVTISLASGEDAVSAPGAVAVRGSAPALETSWDDPQPQPLDGYSPYSFFNALYQGDLNFEMYWDDNADKLTRFLTTLDQADTLFMSSNRQWATTVRVPERYPLTAEYYRDLLGCPPEKSLIWCYSVATPGQFKGKLGYILAATFQSDPQLGPLDINDQFAEEAFTVYDHPKVLVFRKDPSYYDPRQVRTLLSKVDLSQVVHLTPGQASKLTLPGFPGSTKKSDLTLMLPAAHWLAQQAGGTWSTLFNRGDLINLYPALAGGVWYLTITLLGLLVYPFLRIALPGLPDRGYPLARISGLLLMAYMTWMAGSFKIPVTRLLISGIILCIAVVGTLLAIYQRKGLMHELRMKKSYFLSVEGVAMAFFLLDLAIRLGNPDLWHPSKGGEKPMDFSYFNAVIKSTTFPPYDPWFAGGYLNYYYYGFVIVGMLVKWLGIVPSIAYNLILPSLFSMLALGAFSVVWNLIQHVRKKPVGNLDEDPEKPKTRWFGQQFLVGCAAGLGTVVLGNFGTVRMIWQGFQKLAAPGGNIDNVPVLTHWVWSIQGLIKFIGGQTLPYPMGEWYWDPSRVYPGSPITEFPFFTFLYADLHAHMIALPVAALAVAWALAMVLGRGRWHEPNETLSAGKAQPWIGVILNLLLGAMVIGALYPTNTWDYPTYLALGCVALVYTIMRYGPTTNKLPLKPWIQRGVLTLAGLGMLVVLSRLMYQPYYQSFGSAYNSVELWHGDRSPFWSYITHWGLFLFIITSWMGWETFHWMAVTPLSSLKKLYPYRNAILGLLVFLVLAIVYLQIGQRVQIAWLVLLLIAWAGVLLMRPGLPDAKRFVLFLIGTGLLITLTVELVVLQGDIERMNTVFKLYIQAWILLSLSAVAGLGWLVDALPSWSFNWRVVWRVSAAALVAGAALYPLLAGLDKVRDRMATLAPHTLDGMTYMAYSEYMMANSLTQDGVNMDLSQDYRAIIWMQTHVSGSPVIVEGNTVEYGWGTRFTIYTGLPGVVGWNWHQRQQRAILASEAVPNRVAEIAQFYKTSDPSASEAFLKKYNVRYIIVGQLEAADYPGDGLLKFKAQDGKLWSQVYHEANTTIYQVNP